MNGTTPQFAQWNYRILCHPIKKELPLYMLKPVDILSARMKNRHKMLKYEHSRSAQFVVNPSFSKDFHSRVLNGPSYLDELMNEIPGKDNYQGEKTDKGFDASVLDVIFLTIF